MAFSIFELRPAASGQSGQLKESERERGEQRREECNLTNELRAVAPPPPVRSFGSMSRGHRSMMTAWPAPPPVPPPATTGAMQRTTLLTPRRRHRHIQVSYVPEHSIFLPVWSNLPPPTYSQIPTLTKLPREREGEAEGGPLISRAKKGNGQAGRQREGRRDGNAIDGLVAGRRGRGD